MPRFQPHSLTRRLAISGFGVAACTLLSAAAAPAKTSPPRWSATVNTSAIGAHSIGNPAAKVRLIEYFSYTCSHCADFAKLAAVPLKTLYIDKGLVVVEYRNLVRDPLDMTAALLARCGGAKAFSGNHQAIFLTQPTWLGKAAAMSETQLKTWYQGDVGARARRMAADTGLDALMRGRGYSTAQINSCLDNGVAQAELTAMTNIGTNSDRVMGTPTFFINGRMVDGANTWAPLKTRLDAAVSGN